MTGLFIVLFFISLVCEAMAFDDSPEFNAAYEVRGEDERVDPSRARSVRARTFGRSGRALD